MTVVVRIQEADIQDRLKGLGLERQFLLDAVRQGHLAYISCTLNHPPLLPGILAWGETVKSLREWMAPAGWTRSDDNNYSLLVSPDAKMAIAVATGDEQTGREMGNPSNKARKGRNTRNAVDLNQISFDFGTPLGLPDVLNGADEARSTWILLIHRDEEGGEVRCELSLPASITDGHIDSWQERIILGSFPFEDDIVIVQPQQPQPDITINVKRRT